MHKSKARKITCQIHYNFCFYRSIEQIFASEIKIGNMSTIDLLSKFQKLNIGATE